MSAAAAAAVASHGLEHLQLCRTASDAMQLTISQLTAPAYAFASKKRGDTHTCV
jgi:hypothetical protein